MAIKLAEKGFLAKPEKLNKKCQLLRNEMFITVLGLLL